MTYTKSKSLLYVIVVALVLAIAYLMGTQVKQVYAGAPSGLPASVATTTNVTVTTTAGPIFATSTCAARVVTTSAQPIMMTFSDYSGQTPTGSFGHLQAASTTVVYDSGQYGCGLYKIYSFGTQLITVSETR